MDLIAANARLPPGVRFHPMDDVLVMHFLKRKVQGKWLHPGYVAEVDIYQYHPKDLQEMACLKKDKKWYFFCPLRKKYGCGVRTNRTAKSGFWKATGKPRSVLYRERTVGKVQTLVFHQGKSNKAERTDWVMYEYSLLDTELENKGVSNAFVLCEIFEKEGMGPRNGDQYGAAYNEEEWDKEMSNNAPTMPVVSASVVTDSVVINGSVSANVFPLDTPEQVFSGVVSVPVVDDQAPTPTSDPASASVVIDSAVINGSVSANVFPLDTPEQIFSGDVSVSVVYDQAPTPTSDLANVASTSKGNVPVYIEGANSILEANPVPNYADGLYSAELDGEIFGNLEDIWLEDICPEDDLDRLLLTYS